METLTEAVYREFPELRPRPTGYPTFHMTLAYNYDAAATKETADAFLERAGELLPLHLRGETLEVLVERNGVWEDLASCPLAGARST